MSMDRSSQKLSARYFHWLQRLRKLRQFTREYEHLNRFLASHLSGYLQVQLVRIHLRVPEYGWTTQKVFHLMNFAVNGRTYIRAILFEFNSIIGSTANLC